MPEPRDYVFLLQPVWIFWRAELTWQLICQRLQALLLQTFRGRPILQNIDSLES